jgi:DNA replication protein
LKTFTGFSDSETFTSLPDAFFTHLLGEIRDVDEMMVTLYALWRVARMEGSFHALQIGDFTGLLTDPKPGLEKAVARGSLLEVEGAGEKWFFVNSPRGRAAAGALRDGKLEIPSVARTEHSQRPNIFKLYEENIGALTPLAADVLRDGETTYSPEWVAEAISIAVKNNKRNWKYVEAILKRWKEEGHAQEQDRRDAQEPRGRDVTRKVEDFFKR